ncbi:MAG: monofunctional biosynthetic peptidoglycan transglycosylase [Flavobacteriales bacterium]|nr:monofunctional biosynthetic peptidoglycan transglycosylase [Flavobacteriales bacterium]
MATLGPGMVIFRSLATTLIWGMVVTILWVAVLGVFDPPVTWTMLERWVQHGSLQRPWYDADEIASVVPIALVAAEDQRFMEHHGFDLEALRKAAEHNASKRKGRRLKGGSTISQQTAKNVFLWQGRTYLRKGIEVWFTAVMELLWSKERIITVYMNVAETGKGRFGVGAAAAHCFHVPPSRLTREHAALIAVVLPSPQRSDCIRPTKYLLGRRSWVLRQMAQLGDVFAEPPARKKKRTTPNSGKQGKKG